MTLQDQIKAAGCYLQQKNWSAALVLYQNLAKYLGPQSGIWQNIALCHLAQSNPTACLTAAKKSIALNPGNTASISLLSKALCLLNRKEDAIKTLKEALKRNTANPILSIELAALQLNEVGDAAGAQATMAQVSAQGAYAEDVELTEITAGCYDHELTSAELSKKAMRYAAKHIMPWALPNLTPTGTRKDGPVRVGLLSPFFSRSPVYYLAIGSLQHIASQVEFFLFDRNVKSAQGHERQAFKQLAKDDNWISCAHLSPHALAAEIAKHELDVLIDMGGWSDVNGLRALASKPARRMYKWVGGQSLTTGMPVFDGWLTDEYQSGVAHQPLYTEPLVSLSAGYVTYSPPSYIPSVRSKINEEILGIAANPAKVSNSFLTEVLHLMKVHESLKIRFIDRRYQYAEARDRVKNKLSAVGSRISFVVPGSHEEYLAALTQVTAILDTYPYTSGLTAVEALYLGTPLVTKAGTLFCERHGAAHVAFSTQPAITRLEELTALQATNFLTDTKRLNHAALGAELLSLLID